MCKTKVMIKYFLLLLLPLMVYSQGYQVKVVPIGNKEVNGNIHVATLTLIFETNSIGKDIEAAYMIAKNEALKIGADSITFISSTVYSSKVDQIFQDRSTSVAGAPFGIYVNEGKSSGNATVITTGTENDLATYTCRAIKIYKPKKASWFSTNTQPKSKSSKIIVGVVSILMSVIVISVLTTANNSH